MVVRDRRCGFRGRHVLLALLQPIEDHLIALDHVDQADDAGEVVAACDLVRGRLRNADVPHPEVLDDLDPLTKDEKERRADQVQFYIELDGERERSAALQDKAYLLGHWEDDLKRHFNGAKSVNQAMLMFDAMEGRALAAEEKLAQQDALSRAIASIPPNLYWMMGKGRIRPKEPLYAIQLIDPESDIAVVETEAEELADAIDAAVKKLGAS